MCNRYNNCVILLVTVFIVVYKNPIGETALQTINTQLYLSMLNGGQGGKNLTASYFVPQRSSNKIALIQNEVKKLKYEVERLRETSSTNQNGEDGASGHLNNLDKIIDFTSTLLENQDRELTQMIASFQTSINDLITEIVTLTRAQEETYKQLVEQQEENNKRAIVTDAIIDIRSNDFASANEKIDRLRAVQRLQFIVKELYRNHEANAALILNFAMSVPDPDKSVSILKYLYQEMMTNNHKNINNLIRLIATAKNATTPSARSFVEDVTARIRLDAINTIRNDVLTKSEANAVATQQTIEALDAFDPNLTDSIIDAAIRGLYGRGGMKQFGDYFVHRRNKSYNLRGLTAVYNELLRRKERDGHETVTFGYILKKAIADGYVDEPADDERVKRLKDALPECVRNVVFARHVCIKSVHYLEYFFAADGHNYDNDRRRVFTWVPGGKDNVKSEFWVFERDAEDNFYIKNLRYNEYIYAAVNEFNFDKDRRRVFTWIPGGYTFKGSEYWRLESKGENCLLKNVMFDEYLYPIDYAYIEKDRREVATWIPKGCDDQCLWKIEECS